MSSMGACGALWNPEEAYGAPLSSMETCGTQWSPKELMESKGAYGALGSHMEHQGALNISNLTKVFSPV
jgi:hypothetical protein